MKKSLNILSFIPWLFIIVFFITVGLRVAQIGYWPDMATTEYNEYGEASLFLRRIIVWLLFGSYIAFLAVVPLSLYLRYRKGIQSSLKSLVLYSSGILLITFLVWINPLSIFTWFMG